MAASLGARPVVLDGEIVALDARGRPSFERLQPRMHVTSATQVRRLASSTPVTFMAFDVLHLDGRSTTGLPYAERRRLLESLQLQGRSWRTPPAWFGGGAMVLEAAREQGLEGVVAKRLRLAATAPAGAAEDWLKVKHLRTQEVVVGGWKPGSGRREGTIGSLLLGVPGAEGLDYAGKVGTGFTDRALDDLGTRLRALDRAGVAVRRTACRVPDARDGALGRAGASWGRCGSASGRGTGGCATPHGAGCGRTRPRRTSSGRMSGTSDPTAEGVLGGSSEVVGEQRHPRHPR